MTVNRRRECWLFVPVASGHWMLIDERDQPMILRSSWSRHTQGYAHARIAGRLVYAHRLLMGLAPGDRRHVDHRNGDKLDNRRCNLRVVPGAAANGQNRRGGRGSSKHRGVTFVKATGKWRAQVMLNRRNHFLGDHDTEDAAAQAAAEFRRQHMPFSAEAAA